MLLLDCAPDHARDWIVTGYALCASDGTPTDLDPWPACERTVFGALLSETPQEDCMKYIPDTSAIFGADGEHASALLLHFKCSSSCICFICSKRGKDAFPESEREALAHYAETLCPYLQSVHELELPIRSRERHVFRSKLRTEARGNPAEVLDTVARLWKELLAGLSARIWLYNELTNAFVLSGRCDRDDAAETTLFGADDVNPETRCYHEQSIRRFSKSSFPEERRRQMPEQCRDVLSVPLLFKPLSPKEAPMQCLGVINVFLDPGANRHHNIEHLLGLAQDCGFAIQESFTFQQMGILREFNALVSRALGGLTTMPIKSLKTEFFNGVIDIVKRHLQVFGISIFEATEDKKHAVCVATTGIVDDPDLREVRYEKGEGGTGTIFAEGKARITPGGDEVLQGKFIEKSLSQDINDLRLRPFLGVPMLVGQEVIGVVRCVEKRSSITGEPLPFSPHDLGDLTFIADQLAPIMEIIKLQELRELGISVAVHDIRAPASTLRDAAHTLRRSLREMNAYDKVKYEIEDLYNTSLRLLSVVDQAGQVVGAGFTPRKRKTTLEGDIMARLKAMLYDQAKQKEITIHFEGFGDMPPVVVDPNLFEQVMFNLLVNAIKYSYRQTDIEIVAEVMKTKRFFSIKVRNWGESISADEMDNIFLPFYRGESGRRSGSGRGLGLYIVKGIVEAHGGRITVTNREQPVEFTVEMPL